MLTPFRPRPLKFLGVETREDYRLKVYSIRHDKDSAIEPDRFAGGWELAVEALPQPAEEKGRPGLGFVILHQGATGDYLILCWWDQENELPTRIFVNDAEGWRTAGVRESFCVWDLRVMWWERQAYIASILSGRKDGEEAYMAAVAEGFA